MNISNPTDAHWLSILKEQRKSFTMADVKTINHITLLLDHFFSEFGINAYSRINKRCITKLMKYGTIAA